MTARDILKELYLNTLSVEGADAVLNGVLESDDAPDIERVLLLSRPEWTAYGQGATLAEIARWRYHGWPKRCTACGLTIEVEDFGWKVVEADGDSLLKHIRCPSTHSS
jgi:hypothetical protein